MRYQHLILERCAYDVLLLTESGFIQQFVKAWCLNNKVGANTNGTFLHREL